MPKKLIFHCIEKSANKSEKKSEKLDFQYYSPCLSDVLPESFSPTSFLTPLTVFTVFTSPLQHSANYGVAAVPTLPL
ncbi:hypothetical protein B9Z55_001951 [Caenorhabditis nigoni]|uniref:Uncharacterized protein n=1 Tax=Caenorhabditis nigoni TaxID=1611254 RepID=A0A2G5VIL4_9PELO|nr:hypothetical protein B9Z55_001951 [Caenorhabditis nigoni]